MADKKPNAQHNCDLNEIFSFFQKELERHHGFVFKSSGKYQFITEFDEKIACLTESDNPKKPNDIKPRGMYCIYPNMNKETGEYWPVLKGYRFGLVDQEITIAFADHYKNEIKPQRDSNPNYKPPSKEDIEKKVKEFEEQKKKHQIQLEKELLAAEIAIRLEWKRAGKVIDDSFLNTQTNQIQSFKRDIKQMPYMVEKNLEPYGTKIMRKDNFTEAEAIEAVKSELPEAINNKELLNETVENVLLYQKHFINLEPEVEGSKKSGFDLRKSRAIILAPLINTDNKVVNLQKITHHRQKKRNKETNQFETVLHKGKYFFDKVKSKDAFLPISKNPDVGYEKFNPQAKNYLIKEGWATAVSARKAFDAALNLGILGSDFTADNTQVLASYSKANISSVANLIREINPDANIFAGYDNDAGQTLEAGSNPGIQEACHNFSLSGILGNSQKHNRTRAILPPVFKNNLSASDWDDARQYLGIERLAVELAKELNNAVVRMQANDSEVAYIIGRYNRQRQSFADAHPNKDYQVNYGVVIAKADSDFIEMQNIRAKNKESLANYNAEVERRKQNIANTKFQDPNKPRKTVVKPTYKAPSFDNLFDEKPSESKSSIVESTNNEERVKTYLDILNEIDVSKVQNDVLKVVATTDGHQKIQEGKIEFTKMSAVSGENSPKSEMDSMQKSELKIDVSNDLNKPTVKLDSVDPSTIPEQNLRQGVDHQSYAKSAVFTAFWLHSAEMFKAKQLIKAAELNTSDFSDNAVVDEKLTQTQAELSNKHSYPELFVISASDSEYRESIMTVLKDLEERHPEWDNLKQFRENLTTKTIAFDQINLDTLKIQNNVVNLIVGNLSHNQNLEKIKENLTTLLNTSNSLALDREQKFTLVSGLKNTLNNMAKQLQEPPVFQRINEFFQRFDDRINDLVKGEGFKLYGIDPNKVLKPSSPGQSLEL